MLPDNRTDDGEFPFRTLAGTPCREKKDRRCRSAITLGYSRSAILGRTASPRFWLPAISFLDSAVGSESSTSLGQLHRAR